MTELSCLFEQIFHSERNFKARVDHLRALNVKVQEYELKLESAGEELLTKKGELAVKNSKLADVEMEVKLLQLRKAILTTQKKDRREEKIKTSQEYQALVSDLATIRQLFKGKLREFGRCYDLHGSGLKYREEEDRKKIMVLQDELILLETEIIEVESYLEDVCKLQEELNGAERELNCERDREKDLQTSKLETEAAMFDLKNRKISSTRTFNASDLSRLQSELDACKNSAEEQMCQELSKELSDLQRKCYHKQMKLQTARQNRMVAHIGHSEDHDEAEVVNLVDGGYNRVDDECMLEETGTLDKFDDDDDIFKEDEWDIDEIELDRNASQPSMGIEQSHHEENNTASRHKSFPSASFTSYRSTSKYSAAATDFQSANTRGEQGQRNRIPPAVPRTRGMQPLTTPAPTGSQPKTTWNPREHQTVVWSPFPSNAPRKRPGESIFKAPKAQIPNSPKRAKKVRFQY